MHSTQQWPCLQCWPPKATSSLEGCIQLARQHFSLRDRPCLSMFFRMNTVRFACDPSTPETNKNTAVILMWLVATCTVLEAGEEVCPELVQWVSVSIASDSYQIRSLAFFFLWEDLYSPTHPPTNEHFVSKKSMKQAAPNPIAEESDVDKLTYTAWFVTCFMFSTAKHQESN